MGGLAIPDMVDLSPIMYDASLAASVVVGPGSPAPLDRRVAALDYFNELSSKLVGLHSQLRECCENSASCFTRPLEWSRWPRAFFQAALRHRIGVEHFLDPERISCAGCSKAFAPLDYLFHVTGCARRCFFNASSLHDNIRDFYAKLLRPHAYAITPEPTDYSAYKCRNCGRTLAFAEASAHANICTPGTRPLRTGPDLRVQLRPTDQPMVIDFTIVHSLAPSNRGKTFAAITSEKTAKKAGLYETQAESNNEELIVLAATSHCQLAPAWKEFNAEVSEFLGLAKHVLESRLACVIARGVGETVAGARRRAYQCRGANATDRVG